MARIDGIADALPVRLPTPRVMSAHTTLQVLWEPRLSYLGNNLTGVKLGLTLEELGVEYSGNMRVEVVPLSGLRKQRCDWAQQPEPRQHNTSGGALWNAPKFERPDYGISKARKPQRDPRSVSASIYAVV